VSVDGSLGLNFHGGSGDDAGIVIINGTPVNGSLSIDYHGGDGADEAGIVIIGGNVAAEGSYQLNFLGDRGDDHLRAEIDGLFVAGSFGSHFSGGDGADDIAQSVEQTEVVMGAGLEYHLDGGRGDDDLRADVADTALLGTMEINFHGGAGNDTEIASLLNPALLTGSTTPAGSLLVNLWGEAGQDYLSCEAVGEMDGGLTLTCNSGQQSDTINTQLDLDPRGRGPIVALLKGSLGNDALTGLALGTRELSFLVDSFAGFDTAHITRNVTTRGMEEVFFVE